jgi:toxin ParE2
VTVRFLEIAEIELDQAVHWYGAQAPGEGIRRCRLGRFPYGLIYTLDNGDILVLAVAHLHRRPDYWRDRL